MLAETTVLTWPLPSKTSYPARAAGSCSLPLISTSSKANRYVPSSVASEHFALEAFSSPLSPLSSAYPAPPASTPTRPTTPNTTNRAATYLFMRSMPPCFVGPHVTAAAYSCERGGAYHSIAVFIATFFANFGEYLFHALG